MKLGIVVVYLFGEESTALLDLHLRQLAAHTTGPYVIHGSANRLAPPLRTHLAAQPCVRLHDLPATTLRGGEEHAYYLDHLVRLAVADGVTHVAIMHLDSFPVRAGWAEELADRLSDTCVLATLPGIHTACLLFRREFYERYHPPLRLSAAVRASPAYREFLTRCQPIEHTGIGYGFTAFTHGLSWATLRQTQGGGPHDHGTVYDDLIFHLRAAVWLGEQSPPPLGLLGSPAYRWLVRVVSAAGRAVLPLAARQRLRGWLAGPFRRLVDRPRAVDRGAQIRHAKSCMVADLEAYLARLPRR